MRRPATALLCAALGLVFVLSGCAGLAAKRREQADAHYRMAVSFLQQGQGIKDEVNRREAYPELREAIRLDPNNPVYYHFLGSIYLYNGELGKAETETKKALAIDPEYAEAHNNLGQIYVQQGRMTEAIQEFKRALANLAYTTPEYAYYNLGMASFQVGDFLEAAGALEKSIAIMPDNEEAQYYLGRSYARLGKLVQARKAFVRSLEMRPEMARTHYELGVVLFKLDLRGEAKEHFRKVVALDAGGELGEQSKTYLQILN